MGGHVPPGPSVVRQAGSFGRIFGETTPLHSRADNLHSALPCARGGREATGRGRLRAHSPEQQWMSHDRSRTLFDQRSAGAARRHLAKFDLRASALGKSSERGPGLPAVHCRDGDRGAHRQIDDEGEPIQGLRPLAYVGPEDPALLFVACGRQPIPSGQAAWYCRARSCALSEEAVDLDPLSAVTALRNSR